MKNNQNEQSQHLQTVTISQPIFDKLLQIAKEMQTQDNRCTQNVCFMPYCKVQKRGASDRCEERERKEDIDYDNLCIDCCKLYDDEKDLPDDCDECSDDSFNHFNRERETNDKAGVFLTAKACDDHIEANRHHYGESAKSFGVDFRRNSEMVTIINALFEIAKLDMPNHYTKL